MMAWEYEVHKLSEGISAIVYDEHGQRVADHLTEDRARLIAAAPDLKEVAEEAIEALSYAMRGTSDAEQSDKYAATIARIDAALGKAGA